MNREEEVVKKAALALGEPFFVGLINWAKVGDSRYFVGKVKGVCEILELENQIAASARYAAILARDFPEKFKKITDGEREMIKLTKMDIRTDRKFPFRWGDWECEFEIPSKQDIYCYNLIDDSETMDEIDPRDFLLRTIGFKTRIHFPHSRRIQELKKKMVELVKIPCFVIVDGTKINVSLGFDHPGDDFRDRETHIHSWWVEIKERGMRAPKHPLAYRRIGFVDFEFGIGFGIEIEEAEKLNDGDFRSKVILACLSQWLGISAE